MPNIINFAANNQLVTITLDSLANNSVAVSSAIDNSVNRFSSGDFKVTIKTGTGTASNGSVCIMFLKSSDGGITFDDADESNAMILLTFNANVDATTYSVSADTRRNGGQLAEHFKIAVLNETGTAFDNNPANFSIVFTGKRYKTI